MKKKIGLVLIACFLAGVLVTSIGVNSRSPKVKQVTVSDDYGAGGVFYVYKNGELITKKHNDLMEGEEAIENQMKTVDSYNWTYLTLGNGTAPTPSSTTLDSEWASCGLSPSSASITDNGDGNWTLEHTWTASCGTDATPIKVNTTAIWSNNAGTNIDYFAGTDFGRTLDLISDDQVTVEYRSAVQ